MCFLRYQVGRFFAVEHFVVVIVGFLACCTCNQHPENKGLEYYARVSAANILGFGPPRLSRPPVVTVPKQIPASPRALAPGDSSGAPTLRVASATTLEVEIGPPNFDGGDALTYFRIEWDTAADFTSGETNEPLGRAATAAANTLCDSCVVDFDLGTNTFNYVGSADTVRRLSSGAKIYVLFQDDSVSYMFTVRSGDAYAPTQTTIYVEPHHSRASSILSMTASLRVLGATYLINDLTPGLLYCPSATLFKLS